MIAIVVPGAPKQAERSIGRYYGRWIGGMGPVVLIGLFGIALWFVPLSGANPQRDKLLLGGGMLAFLVLWWAFVWLRPTIAYRKHRKAGHILEIRDKATHKFLRDYYNAVEARTRRLNDATGRQRQYVLLEITRLDLKTASGQQQRDVLFAAALQKLNEPDPLFEPPPAI